MDEPADFEEHDEPNPIQESLESFWDRVYVCMYERIDEIVNE